MMTNKCSRLIAYRWFTTDAYQTCCFQFKIYPFLLVDTENCFSFENECDFMLSYWSSLGTVLRVTKTFSVSSWKVHFPLWYCTLLLVLLVFSRNKIYQKPFGDKVKKVGLYRRKIKKKTSACLRSVQYPKLQIFVKMFWTNLQSPVWSDYIGVPP